MLQRSVLIPAVLVALTLGSARASAATLPFGAVDIAPGDLATVLGPQIASLDATAAGYNFGGPLDPLRNLNIISRVFESNSTVNLGPVTLNPGDKTFVYELDYSLFTPGDSELPVEDFKLFRVVELAADANPGPMMAFSEMIAAGYNVDATYNGKPFEASGVTYQPSPGLPGFDIGEVQFSYSIDNAVLARERAMIFLFTTPETLVWRMGYNSANGVEDTNVGIPPAEEGGNVIGGNLNAIPVLVPVVPEPASVGLLVIGAGLMALRRRG